MKGLHAVCRACDVVKKDSYQGQTGVVYQMQLEGHGFNHTVRTNDKAVADTWPALGAEVDVIAKLEPTRDGSFRIGVVNFAESSSPPARSSRPANPAA